MEHGKDNNVLYLNPTKSSNMKRISTKQRVQDWFTQRWVIACGRKFNPQITPWLIGPFGQVGDVGEQFIYRLAKEEQLSVRRGCVNTGLLPSIQVLGLSPTDEAKIAPLVVDFYERTSSYNVRMSLRWNPLFIGFGFLINILFSNRLKQLYIPTNTKIKNEPLTSEIIQLITTKTKEVRYTFWLRTLPSLGTIIFSGVYGSCQLPSGGTAVKAVFPLPNGNATVLMNPQVGQEGELILNSSGRCWGDAGFYFLLQDTENKYWAKFISSFKDKLTVRPHATGLLAQQRLKLWGLPVLSIVYHINPKNNNLPQ